MRIKYVDVVVLKEKKKRDKKKCKNLEMDVFFNGLMMFVFGEIFFFEEILFIYSWDCDKRGRDFKWLCFVNFMLVYCFLKMFSNNLYFWNIGDDFFCFLLIILKVVKDFLIGFFKILRYVCLYYKFFII